MKDFVLIIKLFTGLIFLFSISGLIGYLLKLGKHWEEMQNIQNQIIQNQKGFKYNKKTKNT